jgi:hypothetical protein
MTNKTPDLRPYSDECSVADASNLEALTRPMSLLVGRSVQARTLPGASKNEATVRFQEQGPEQGPDEHRTTKRKERKKGRKEEKGKSHKAPLHHRSFTPNP